MGTATVGPAAEADGKAWTEAFRGPGAEVLTEVVRGGWQGAEGALNLITLLAIMVRLEETMTPMFQSLMSPGSLVQPVISGR